MTDGQAASRASFIVSLCLLLLPLLLLGATTTASAQPAAPATPPATPSPAPAPPSPGPAPPSTPAPPAPGGAFAFAPLGSNQPPPSGDRRDEALVRGGAYDRPYLLRAGQAFAIGGYLDVLGSWAQEQGISQGFSFEARRFNLFHSSTIANAIRLMSELEVEHGHDVSLEMAHIDIRFHHALVLRGGVVLVPVGRFNLAHDSPRYDLVDRPLVSTRIIPSTWSDIGGGVFGALYPGRHRLSYEIYLINGLGDGLVSAGGTRFADGKDRARFALDKNGSPAVTGRLAWDPPGRAQIALSFYTGQYNRSDHDGLRLDDPRRATLVAADAEVELGPVVLRGEGAFAVVEVPDGLKLLASERQFGVFLEGVWRVFRGRLGIFDQAQLLVAARFDHVDLHLGRFPPGLGGSTIGDETSRASVGLSFRPGPVTSLRLTYQHDWMYDLLRNLVQRDTIQLGLASYF